MPNRRTRNRQLARVAERRYAERRRARRRRTRAIAAVVVGVLAIGLLAAFYVVPMRSSDETASATPSASPCSSSVPKRDAGRRERQFDEPPKMSIDVSKTYTATIETSCGTIEVELLAERAPKTVNNFVFLADKHFYDGTQIHRIDTGIDVIQGGDPTGTGRGGPGYTIPDEATGDESYGPGVVAMANSGRPDSGGSQFFIVFGEGGHTLDDNPVYTIFGTVVKGLDVVKRIGSLPIVDPQAAAGGDLSGQKPVQAVYLDRVTVSTKG